MIPTTTDRPTRCPFLRPDAPAPRGTAALYCALPHGGVRVPEPFEVAQLCAPGNFERCPTYALARARRRALDERS